MKPAKRYTLRPFCILAAAMVVLSAVLFALRQADSSGDISSVPRSPAAAAALSRSARKSDAQPHSRAAKLPSQMTQLLAALEDETGPMAFEGRASKSQETIERLASENVPAALAIVASLPGNGSAETAQPDLELRLVQRWAEQDIYSAALWCKTSPPDIREEAFRRIGMLWAQKDLAEAIGWASQIEGAKLREAALLAVAAEAANSSPLTALETCAALSQSPAREEIMSRAAAKWAAQSPVAAADWAAAFPDDQLKPQLLSAIAISWGDTDPSVAARFAIEQISPGPVQERTALAILQRWVLREPQVARSWAEQFPPGRLREQALATISRVWEKQNLEFAATRDQRLFPALP